MTNIKRHLEHLNIEVVRKGGTLSQWPRGDPLRTVSRSRRSLEEKFLWFALACLLALISLQFASHFPVLRKAMDSRSSGFVADTSPLVHSDRAEIELHFAPTSSIRDVAVKVNSQTVSGVGECDSLRVEVQSGDVITVVNRTRYRVMVSSEPRGKWLSGPRPGSSVFVEAHHSISFPPVQIAQNALD